MLTSECVYGFGSVLCKVALILLRTSKRGVGLFGVLAILREATVSFVMAVRPHGRTRLPLDGSWRNLIFEFFENLSRKFKFYWNPTRLASPSREQVSTFMTISRWIILRMRNVLGKIVDKFKPQILCSITFFENCAVYEIMQKNVMEPERPQMTLQHGV